MRSRLLLFIMLLAFSAAKAQFTTPNTGVRWGLNDLVTASAARGSVTFNNGEYFINDSLTIAQNDTLIIDTNETLKLENKILITIAGTLLVNPPDSVKITAVNTANLFHSLRFESFSDASVLRKTIVEYGSGIKIISADIRIDSCIIRYNGHAYNSGAINASGCRPVITNSKFIRNSRSAILTPANIATAPVIRNNLFFENSTVNGNYPQINLGLSGNDTILVLDNTVIGIINAAYNAGGISVSNLLGTGNSNFLIARNHITHNRYGIGVVGNNMKGYIKSNRIEANNVNPNALTGGSGINFNGTTNTQQVVAARNIIRNNLWGVTIQSGGAVATGPKPSLGKIGAPDTADVGLNQIYDNFNNGTTSGQVWDLYNNTTDTIFAQNNLWGTTDTTVIESHIFHKADNSAHGLVNYLPLYSTPATGIKPEITRNALKLYPNPASDLVHLDLNGMVLSEKSDLRIFNNLAQEVFNLKLTRKAGTLELNTSELPAGLYVYRLVNGSEIYTGKLLINR